MKRERTKIKLLPGREQGLLTAILCIQVYVCNLYSYPSYEDANYSEKSGAYRNCARCHRQQVNPAGYETNILASRTRIFANEEVNLTLKDPGGINTVSSPGMALYIVKQGSPVKEAPLVYGWSITSNPSGGTENYLKMGYTPRLNNSYVLRAPTVPGIYRFMASVYFIANEGYDLSTLDTKDTATIEVLPGLESHIPRVLKVISKYRSFVFIKFSEAVDSLTAVERTNYRIWGTLNNKPLSVRSVNVSEDRTVVRLSTLSHKSGMDYRIQISGVKDYSLEPNEMQEQEFIYTPDFSEPYRFYPDWSQGLVPNYLSQSPSFNRLGRDSISDPDQFNRIIYTFHFDNSYQSILSRIFADKVVFRVKIDEVLIPSITSENWKVTWIQPDSNSWSYAGNNMQNGLGGQNISATVLHGGGTPAEDFDNQISFNLEEDADSGALEWDLSEIFAARNNTLSSSYYNDGDLILRVQSAEENSQTGLVSLMAADADDILDRPVIEVYPMPPDTLDPSTDVANTGDLPGKFRMTHLNGILLLQTSLNLPFFIKKLEIRNISGNIIYKESIQNYINNWNWKGYTERGQWLPGGIYIIIVYGRFDTYQRKFFWNPAP